MIRPVLLGLVGPVANVVGSTFESAKVRGYVSDHQTKDFQARFLNSILASRR